MHSPNQLVSIRDVQQSAELIAAFLSELEPDAEFLPL
jgi:putative aminopeptidase FrvX